MAVTTPPTLTLPGLSPDRSDRATFTARSIARDDYIKNTQVPQLTLALANVFANATDAATTAGESATSAGTAATQAGNAATSAGTATTQAGTATTQAGIATTQAGNAAASAMQASKLNLGSKTSAPTVDNQGAALLTGATYYDTTLSKWRAWSGSAWVDGISAVAGVSTVNGTSGAVVNIATTAANTFTAAQEWATGAAISSAATVNLDTATGNRVHITGTTAITAVTLTRGPRTVIFDGVLTLTHNVTTNNLPGAANITTAVGDRAIYESDGTAVYCVSYIKVSGASVVPASVGDHFVTVHTGNGAGSSSTGVRRFTTVSSSAGTDVTYSDSASLGGVFTIVGAGLYAMQYGETASNFSITRNSTDLTGGGINVPLANRLVFTSTPANGPQFVTTFARLLVNDRITAQVSSAFTPGYPDLTYFTIRKIGV